MTQDEINKAFEGRWRFKGNIPSDLWNEGRYDVFAPMVKEVCRDFFEAGLVLGQRDYVPLEKLATIKQEMPLTTDDARIIKDPVEKQFDLWWKMYDKKCGRADCLKKWKKLSFDERIDCMNATPDYVASTPDKQFRKNPLSYLNQKAWNDEIIPRNNGTNQPTLEQQRKSKLADILTD